RVVPARDGGLANAGVTPCRLAMGTQDAGLALPALWQTRCSLAALLAKRNFQGICQRSGTGGQQGEKKPFGNNLVHENLLLKVSQCLTALLGLFVHDMTGKNLPLRFAGFVKTGGDLEAVACCLAV